MQVSDMIILANTRIKHATISICVGEYNLFWKYHPKPSDVNTKYIIKSVFRTFPSLK